MAHSLSHDTSGQRSHGAPAVPRLSGIPTPLAGVFVSLDEANTHLYIASR
ncbi:protein of unknown function [Streptomyces murinus]